MMWFDPLSEIGLFLGGSGTLLGSFALFKKSSETWTRTLVDDGQKNGGCALHRSINACMRGSA